MRARLLAPLAVALLIAPAASAGTLSTVLDEPREFLVGYNEGALGDALTLLAKLDVDVLGKNEQLRLLVVSTRATAQFLALAPADPAVEYVEGNDIVRLAGAQWNGAQWNGAQWNGAQWNGAQWNGAQWNDADLKHVSEAQRQAAKWTEYQYQLESTNKMKWAGDSTDPGLVWQYAPWATDANFAWTAGFTGTRSASLCVLDSGVAWDHPDIAPNHVASYNAINPAASAYDDGGHGTHIAGIAAGALANAYGVAGVANVKILSAKVLDANGAGYESDLAFGLVWCALQGADVAVMALGVTETEHPTLLRALQYAADRDVLLLASAGNTGGAVGFPASDPRVVAVGAVDGRLHRASFSSTGSAVELAAPGVHMLGPLPASMGGFAFGSGTSQAVAYAAGVAALVRDIDGDLTAAQARALLASTARDLGPAGRDASFGHGLVDVRAAALAAAA